jgi:Cu+-exporting ATPase
MTHRINTVVLDKTGTITNGTPVLTDVITDKNKTEFLSFVGSAEKGSEHPLALAIVDGMKEQKIPFKEVAQFENISGYGIKANVDGKEVLVGTRRLMKKYDIDIPSILERMEELEKQGKTAMITAVDGEYVGLVAV